MRITFITLWIVFGATSVFAQFESLADKDTAKDKLDHFCRFANAVRGVPGYRVRVLGEDRNTVQVLVGRR